MDLLSKAAEAGIESEFIDVHGHRRVTDPAALEAILAALPGKTPYRFVDGPVVVRSGLKGRTALRQAVTLPVAWKIVAGLKVIAKGTVTDRTLVWPA
ncbi:MAG: 4-alpha-glucanotransferase, partial [Bradyrhizobium sp.]|nr:4-alpha-glucanotransferase [Bradyrhizobium sp.]